MGMQNMLQAGYKPVGGNLKVNCHWHKPRAQWEVVTVSNNSCIRSDKAHLISWLEDTYHQLALSFLFFCFWHILCYYWISVL